MLLPVSMNEGLLSRPSRLCVSAPWRAHC